MIETLFGYAPLDKNKNDRKKEPSTQDSMPQYIQILDPKKAQNLAILLRALNVTTEEVCDALREGDFLHLIYLLKKCASEQHMRRFLYQYSGQMFVWHTWP